MEEENRVIPIRSLTWGDREMFQSFIEEVADSPEFARIKELIVFRAVTTEEEEKDPYSDMIPLAESLFKILRERCLPKLKAWLVDLTGLSEVEFNETMPFDADVLILNQILSQREFAGFFSGASLLFSRIKESVTGFLARQKK